MIKPLDIPGYREAIEAENQARVTDYLDAPSIIGEVCIAPLTIRRMARLQSVGSRFVVRDDGPMDAATEIALFLWALSPHYEHAYWLKSRIELHCPRLARWLFNRIRNQFVKRISKMDAETIIDDITRLLKHTFEDSPGNDEQEQAASPFAWPTSFVGMLAEQRHWTEGEILDMPLRRVFQHVRSIIRQHKPDAILFNPSDKVRGAWLREVNEQRN